PEGWSADLPVLMRYVFSPSIALIVGACVGVLAKSRPGTIAVFALLPVQLGFMQMRWPDFWHSLFLLILGIINILLGVFAATGVFRMRTRTARNSAAVTG